MKTLVIFHLWHGPLHSDLSKESSVWYAKHYESYFDQVYVISLIGKSKELVTSGRTTYLTIGSGNNKKDIFLAPLKLYSFAKKVKASTLISYEQIWLWWLTSLLKLFRNTKVYLLPITSPEQMYKATGKSLSGNIPIWLERILIKASYWTANIAISSTAYGDFVNWITANKILSKKTVILNQIPEAIPTPAFFENIQEMPANNSIIELLYVGRLHKEKLVDDIIKMMVVLKETSYHFKLTMVGDGPEKASLIQLATELGVIDNIEFVGYLTNGRLPYYYCRSFAFISPLTGSSLREAALCGVPIIAYTMDWLTTVLTHEETYFGVSPRDYEGLASAVIQLLQKRNFREKIATNVKVLAWKTWSPQDLKDSLSKAFS